MWLSLVYVLMSDDDEAAKWCKHCGSHKILHDKKLGDKIAKIDHEFEAKCTHPDSFDLEYSNLSYCPDCDIQYLARLVLGSSTGPQPEFPLDELVTADVKEPEIEFNYGLCKICEIPLTEEYEHVSFCGDCADDTWQVLMSGNKGEGNLPN